MTSAPRRRRQGDYQQRSRHRGLDRSCRAVEPVHLMFRFAMGRTVTYRRLAALEAAGLVERVRLLYGQPGLIVVTKAGLRLCGLQALGVTKVSAGVARHWQASSLVAVILEHHHGRGAVG